MLYMIVATDKNNAIGKDNALAWQVPEDLQYFKEKTTGKTIVMGYKTYQSIGRLLPNRTNIILSRKPNLHIDGAIVTDSIDLILEKAESEDVFIIGGGEIYKMFLPFAKGLYITLIDLEVENADTFFPSYDDFYCNSRQEKRFSKNQDIPYQFTYWENKK